MGNAVVDYVEGESRLWVRFPYDESAKEAIKQGIQGRKFVPKDEGGPAWTVPATLMNARKLREIFGSGLKLTTRAIEWGRVMAGAERNLLDVAGADDAELVRLPEENPALYEFISSRPFQRADASFMAQANSINANEPGLGKTVETIAAIYEAGVVGGAHLVIAPVTSLRDVWEFEWARWGGEDVDVFVAQGPDRDIQIAKAFGCPNAFVLITNPDTIRRKGELLKSFGEWTSITIDEYHLSGLPNTKSVFYKTINSFKAKRKYCISGTPFGGKPEKLWPALHFIEPKVYTSKWAWINSWLEVNSGYNGHPEVGGIKPGLEQKFFKALRPHLVRRLKSEVAKDLPPINIVPVWLEMTEGQTSQYTKFARDAEVMIDDEALTATNILAEYTRLKQFANAKCELRPDGKLIPTKDSNKMQALLGKLAERGIGPEGSDSCWGDQQAVVGSQFTEMVYATARFLEENGIEVSVLTGETKATERSELRRKFQAGEGPRVFLINTKAGGVSITLDRADSIHILDETYNPDDQTQLINRVHRLSRIHQVDAYFYRSKHSIDYYIQQLTQGKELTNKDILDLRRMIKKGE